VASSEGAVGAIADLHDRGLIAASDGAGAPGCAFIPAAAGTMLTPTSPISRSTLEELVHRYRNDDDPAVRGGVKYHCNRLPDRHRLCAAQPMEWLEFGNAASLGAQQERVLRFVLPEGGECDGFHLSLRVEVTPRAICRCL